MTCWYTDSLANQQRSQRDLLDRLNRRLPDLDRDQLEDLLVGAIALLARQPIDNRYFMHVTKSVNGPRVGDLLEFLQKLP